MEESKHGGMRPVDLARAAGISAQQVRNHEDAGVLPPAPRTPAGHRRYAPVHLGALLAHRALSRGFGPDTARRVMVAVHARNTADALALLDAAHADLHTRRRLLHEAAAALGAPHPEDERALPRGGLEIGAAAARLAVRPSALRVWEEAGLLAPARDPITGYRRYAAADLREARAVALLRENRYPLDRIRPVLDELRGGGDGGGEALRAALDQRRDELARRARAMLAGSARLDGFLTEFAEPAPGAGGPPEPPLDPRLVPDTGI